MSKAPHFTFLTWNLSMMERSDFAPVDWRRDQTEAEIRKIVLELDPDFVFFQELPGMVPFVETHGMVPANTKGQIGDLAILAKHQFMDSVVSGVMKNAVLAVLPNADMTVANVHLPSAKSGDQDRLAAFSDLLSETDTTSLVVIGDTNTRTAETKKIDALGLGGARPPEPTWNGRKNPFRYGARGYTAYFTRAFHTKDLALNNQLVLTEPIEAEGTRFHLSDHFALFGEIAGAVSEG
jgi:endonuclease/exonuclease/phosphatase family metal-dependent hydrolase